MKQTLLATAVAFAGVLAISGSANAASSITVGAATNYAADVIAVPDAQIIWDFDTIFNPLFDYTPSSAVDIGSTPGISQAPTGNTTVYGVVDPTQSPATFEAFKGLKSFSFMVGSPDKFNRIRFLRTNNTVLADLTGGTGLFGALAPIKGPTRRVNYDFGVDKVGKIEFYSNVNASSYAFEFDRFAGVVPEPASWALMITGFFGLGTVLRASRKRQQVAA